MEIHNKIQLAGGLLVEAVRTYRSGAGNIDFAKSILLAGAVIGVVAPCLEEQDEKSSHIQLAEVAAKCKGIDLIHLTPKEKREEFGRSIVFYRLAYNSLKHAGGRRKKASDDLFFEADLKKEAYFLIGSAIDDYNKIALPQGVINADLSNELLDLLQSHFVG